ncbi:uncharacterized protein [Diadema antillarum]|uniref:uncharacterized protein n=1 Tax=Diadema antillarum TaxID=105358 RepID=UPI003A8AAFAF
MDDGDETVESKRAVEFVDGGDGSAAAGRQRQTSPAAASCPPIPSGYRLRRIGAKPSCEGVKDVFRLQKSRNILGRNQTVVDFFLDSTIYTRLISRQHAEIVIETDENQSPVITVIDKSLNGTFINDVKIKDQAKMEVGDTLTLGHIQGVQVKHGSFAQQPNSEFRFVLEHVDITKVKSAKAAKLSPSKNSSESPKKQKGKLLRSPNHKRSEDETSASTAPRAAQEVPPPPPMMHQPVVRVVESKDADRVMPIITEAMGEEMRMIHGDDGKVTVIYSFPVRSHGASPTNGDSVNRNVADEERARGRGVADGVEREDEARCNKKNQNAKAAGNSTEAVFEFESEPDADNEKEVAAIQDRVNAICQMEISSGAGSASSSKKKSEATSSRATKGKSSQKGAPSSSTSSRGRTKRRGRPVTHIHSHKKKHIPASAASSSSAVAVDDFVPQPCDSPDCCRPRDLTVSWVQCDDCDSWYHVTCVGCDYDKVKQPDTSFNCGCT